ncbi:unnamed protein product [Miscanthus lutarioriparius]|uniref:Uncharacterized protein n=1 Tax=Miscanthus lutarioriparius TaxID=422564 RepID=A0A811QG76_9POAL|nr:unnamed protein product [Miscanthus lutarioriparius]
MASAAMLRSAARSLRLRKPLEPERCLLARRFLSSSSVPTERHTCSPSSNKPLKGIMEQKSHVNEKPENIYKRLLMKVDKISEGLDEHSRLLKELEAEIKENNKTSSLDEFAAVSCFSKEYLGLQVENLQEK